MLSPEVQVQRFSMSKSAESCCNIDFCSFSCKEEDFPVARAAAQSVLSLCELEWEIRIHVRRARQTVSRICVLLGSKRRANIVCWWQVKMLGKKN